MYKRGQFFLVAALIVIVVIFGVATVYNSISNTKSDQGYTQNLADDIKKESFQVINNGFFNDTSQSKITSNLNNLTLIYSKANPSFNITYISYYNGSYVANTFVNNLVFNVSSNITYTTNNITLGLNNIYYSFNLTKGYNLFVVVQNENNNEKYIATA